MIRKTLILSLVLSFLLTFAACGRTSLLTPVQQVRGVIRRTETEPRRFVYKEASEGRQVNVVGVIQDDYSYRARVSINGQPVLDEVAVDDAIAMRFLAPELIADFVTESPNPAGGESFEALRSRRWVLDRAGAPDLTRPGFQERSLGVDPVIDALTVFDLIEVVIREAAGIRKYNPQALDYVEREDRFPKPAEGSDVERYDFPPPPLAPITGAPDDVLPDAPNFRRMSFYIKDGLALRVLETIDLQFRVKELTEALDLNERAEESRRFLSRGVASINDLRLSRGLKPIRLRTMSFELVDVGKTAKIDLPADFVEGDLSLIRNRGKAAGNLSTGGRSAPTVPDEPSTPIPGP